ncbi:MAG: hypothetical protein ABJB74_18125 [Gemmatimonas sp.]
MFYLLKPERTSSDSNEFERKSLERKSLAHDAVAHNVYPSVEHYQFNWGRLSKIFIFWILVFVIPIALMQYAYTRPSY